MSEKRILIVEGKDDLHVLAHLFKHYGLEGRITIRDKEGIDQVKSGFERLLEAIAVEIASSDTVIGVVVDADADLKARWQSLADRLTGLGYDRVPTVPTEGGVVLKGQGALPRFGAWVMPNNTLPGMIEDFMSQLVPRGSEALWERAVRVVSEIPEQERRFSVEPDHSSKAQIHTYLAWQETPGKPLGLAITFKYFDAASATAERFIAWIRGLYELEPISTNDK